MTYPAAVNVATPQYPEVTTSDFLVDPSGPWFYSIDKISKSGQTVWIEEAYRVWRDDGYVPMEGRGLKARGRKRLNRLFGLTFVSINGKAVVLWGGKPMKAGE